MTDLRRTLLWVVFTMSLVLLWDAGTATALGGAVIADAADVGAVGVFRPTADGRRPPAAVVHFEAYQPLASPADLRNGMMEFTNDRFRERFTALVEQAIQQHGR